jgi:hypothetical protein
MLDSMNAALVSPEERDLHLYDALSNPVLAAGHLRLRGLRRSNPRALRASVLQAIAALEVIAGFRLPELWGANEPSAASLAAMNVLLGQVRYLRREFGDQKSADLREHVEAAGSDLLAQFEQVRQAALARLGDMESLLVLFGAGTDEDAELGFQALPEMPEVAPGPSVELKLS